MHSELVMCAISIVPAAGLAVFHFMRTQVNFHNLISLFMKLQGLNLCYKLGCASAHRFNPLVHKRPSVTWHSHSLYKSCCLTVMTSKVKSENCLISFHFRPDDDWRIQLKRWQVISQAQVGNITFSSFMRSQLRSQLKENSFIYIHPFISIHDHQA